ncbi:Thermolysin metallopeptidase, catalytic domain [Singulisphaera sp. GP187]|uniref:M4 family metallopeptidase n=1 Tax=Singulisphaera sp. GP187 TaxID=1882752 RepID=UPI000928F88A|nr:M4 family metallopeptidase [Singulisphaera sp. GP187]SIO35770.1 Thermolysin metallopeptidase, catalytic domain [Singulisphaera sp. GP187]
MNPHHDPILCIVPPHILHALAASDDEKLREIGLRSLIASSRLRGRRDIFAQSALGTPTGTLRRTIYDAKNNTTLPGDLVRSEGGPLSSDQAVNEAYDGLGATYKLYSDIYHRNSIDDLGMRLDASVHFGQDYDNAFFDGRQMVFGDGDGVIFTGFTKAIDVIGHELTHGVTQFTADLEYHDQSGALNESMSDVFGSLVKQYSKKQTAAKADWLIGSGILAPGVNGQALRSMKAPGTAYDDDRLGGKDPQPAHMSDYVDLPNTESGDHGGVHINSGIPNHAFYLAAVAIAGPSDNAWDGAGLIWYNALLRLWRTAQFQDCADVTHEVAGTLFGTNSAQQQAVGQAWSNVGIEIQATSAAARSRAAKSRGRAAAKASGNGNLKKELEHALSELSGIMERM